MADTRVDFGILAGAGAPVRHFKAGEVIFRQGDAAEELFVIQSGTVEIRLGNRVLDTLPQLSIFGEMGADRQLAAQRDGDCRNRRDAGSRRREAVSVPGRPHAAFRAQRDARPGAAAAHDQQRDLGRQLINTPGRTTYERPLAPKAMVGRQNAIRRLRANRVVFALQ
jgi:CRP-like cAMP-binding protein